MKVAERQAPQHRDVSVVQRHSARLRRECADCNEGPPARTVPSRYEPCSSRYELRSVGTRRVPPARTVFPPARAVFPQHALCSSRYALRAASAHGCSSRYAPCSSRYALRAAGTHCVPPGTHRVPAGTHCGPPARTVYLRARTAGGRRAPCIAGAHTGRRAQSARVGGDRACASTPGHFRVSPRRSSAPAQENAGGEGPGQSRRPARPPTPSPPQKGARTAAQTEEEGVVRQTITTETLRRRPGASAQRMGNDNGQLEQLEDRVVVRKFSTGAARLRRFWPSPLRKRGCACPKGG
jgi:hypothetical protein